MSISKHSILLELNISVWTANKVDRRVTNKATTDANATYDAGQFKKNLMAGSTMRKGIADFAAETRTWNNAHTLPWQDKGGRLLPMTMFLDYKKLLESKQAYFNDQVEKFIASYPDLVLAAQASLGDMFDASEYPSVDAVRQKFGFRFVFSPVPEMSDFRITLEQEGLDYLREQYEAATEQRVNDVIFDVQTQLREKLEFMSNKLAEPDGDSAKVFHGTFLTKAEELCERLVHLNITGDDRITKANEALMRIVKGANIEDIRKEEETRADLKASIDKVLEGFSGW